MTSLQRTSVSMAMHGWFLKSFFFLVAWRYVLDTVSHCSESGTGRLAEIWKLDSLFLKKASYRIPTFVFK